MTDYDQLENLEIGLRAYVDNLIDESFHLTRGYTKANKQRRAKIDEKLTEINTELAIWSKAFWSVSNKVYNLRKR
jgi:hypothetical protein